VDYPAGLTCEIVVVRFERYLTGDLPRHDALAIAAHLEACVLCAQLLALLRGTFPTTPRPSAGARTEGRSRAPRRGQPPRPRPSL
jgi:anti-sigma factor RsiW